MKVLAIFAAAASIAALSACNKTTVNANEGPYGGDPSQPTIQAAQKLAVERLRNLKSCSFPADVDQSAVEWITENSLELANDIESSPHVWVQESNVPCARTSHKKGSKIVFSYSNCEKISPDDAFIVLVHESVHHFGIADEIFPTRVADTLLKTSEGNCVPDLKDVLWLDKNITSWPATAEMKSIEVTDKGICYDFTPRQTWPEIDPFDAWKTIGNYWIIAYIRGKWFAATYEWIIPPNTCNEDNAASIALGTKQKIFEGWVAKKGELVGFMVSSVVRLGHTNNVQERSPVYWKRWP